MALFAGCLVFIELECCVMVAGKPLLGSSDQPGVGPAWSSQSHQRDFAFVSVCSRVALGLNQVCLEFAGSSGTVPIKPEEEQPIAWKRQSVSTASLGSHVFGTLEQQQPCFAC